MLTVKQVAERLGVAASLVYGWIGDGSLPHIKLGARGKRGRIRITEEDLTAFLTSRRQSERTVVPQQSPRTRKPKFDHLTVD